MRNFSLASFALSALLMPLQVLAAVPPNVTGLSAEVENNTIVVRWNKVQSNNIDFYEVFYSSEPILENDGEYDDFEITEGPVGKYVFKEIPEGNILYFAVLAVNNDGEESEFFVEEVSLNIPGGISSSQNLPNETDGFSSVSSASTSSVSSLSSSSSSVKTSSSVSSVQSISSSSSSVSATTSSSTTSDSTAIVNVPIEETIGGQQSLGSQESSASSMPLEPAFTDGFVHLMTAQAVSPTEVLLTFSHPVQILPKDAPSAFLIRDTFGRTLAIQSITIDNATILVRTVEQQSNRLYEIALSEPLEGYPSMPLHVVDRNAFFTGHPAANGSGQFSFPLTSSNPPPVGSAEDPIGYLLYAAPNADGTYNVVGTWNRNPLAKLPVQYIFTQSLDDGKTFSEPQALPGAIGGIEIKGVVPGLFGLKIQILDEAGKLSEGVFQTIQLPGNRDAFTQVVTSPITATTIPIGQPIIHQPSTMKPGKSGGLSDSGPGIASVAVLLAGGLLGWMKSRKLAKA